MYCEAEKSLFSLWTSYIFTTERGPKNQRANVAEPWIWDILSIGYSERIPRKSTNSTTSPRSECLLSTRANDTHFIHLCCCYFKLHSCSEESRALLIQSSSKHDISVTIFVQIKKLSVKKRLKISCSKLSYSLFNARSEPRRKIFCG